jgi:Protein of unknown function (DUF3093)
MPANARPSAPLYRERLRVSWWAWPACLSGAVFLGIEVTMGAPQLQLPEVYAGFVGAVAIALLLVGRIRIRVQFGGDGEVELRVDDARLPVSAIAAVEVVGGEDRRRLLGLDAEPLAFVIQRPWLPSGVRIDLADPSDPTPYWFVSTRRPDELAAVLNEARVTA